VKIKSKVVIVTVLAVALFLSISIPVLAAVPTVETYNADVSGIEPNKLILWGKNEIIYESI